MIKTNKQKVALVVFIVIFTTWSNFSYADILQKFTNNISNRAVRGGAIINQGDVDLILNSVKYKQPDGTYLFQVPTTIDQIYRYGKIMGTDGDDTVTFDGKITVDTFNLRKGKNTLNIKAKSELSLDPNVGPDASLNFYNVANFNIAEGVRIDKFRAIYGNYDLTINFTSPDSSNTDNDINIPKFSLAGNGSNVKGFININNAKVVVKERATFSTQDETLTLKDAVINKDGTPDQKTISILEVDKGLSIPGGNNTINMGKYSKIIAPGEAIQLNGNNIVNMDIGATIQGNLLFRDGNNTINIASIGKDHYQEDASKIVVDGITFGNGQNNINIQDYSNFVVNSSINAGGGTTRIFVGNNSLFTVNGEIIMLGGNNYVRLGANSLVSGSFKFASVSSNNTFIVDTGSDSTTLKGSIRGSGNNDSFALLGTGILHIEPTVLGEGLDGFNNINLGQARVDFSKPYSQTNDATITLSLLENDQKEQGPRMDFKALAQFNNRSLNIRYRGVTKYLGKVGSSYKLTLFTVGAPGSGMFSKFSDIGLKDLTFQSALYKMDYSIVDDSLDLNLTKCSTFKDAVSGKDLCDTGDKTKGEEYVVQIAGFLDQLVDIKNLSQKYYDMLDDLAMMNVAELVHTLEGFVPVNNTVLFNINKNLADNFKGVTLNSKPYKITKNDITLWSSYNYSKVSLDDIKGARGAAANGNIFMIGGEYSLFSFLKLGANMGYSKPDINGNGSTYSGNSSNFYYGVYGNSSITNNLTLNLNLGFLNSNYDLTREVSVNGGERINGKPKFNQTDVDALLSYKVRLGSFMLTPFATAGYSYGSMDSYSENGFMAYKVDKSTFSTTKGGIGIKALAVGAFGNAAVIPSVTLALNASSQNTESTKVHIAEFSDISTPINFTADNYGGISGMGSFGISYVLNNGITLDFNLGTNMGNKVKAYNFGAAVNITL